MEAKLSNENIQCVPGYPNIRFYKGRFNGGALASLVLSGQTKNYTCAPLLYEDLSDFKTLIEHLTIYVDYLIETLEEQTGKTVCGFTIGKTYTGKPQKNSSPFDPRTWSMRGMTSRWSCAYGPHGYSAMVALCAIGQAQLPGKLKPAWKTPEGYAIAIEGALLAHYAYAKHDTRLANESMQHGRPMNDKVEYALIYVAFKLMDDNINTGEGIEPVINESDIATKVYGQ